MALEELNALEHYGTKGMHWGQRLYQNPDGSYTELGKERRRVGYKKAPEVEESEKIGGKAYKDMTWSERHKARKRARHNEAERKAQRHFNKDKRRAIEDGDLSFISKNISRFSNDEIDEATARFKKMKTLLDLAKENEPDPEKFVDKALKWLDKASKASKSVSDISKNINEAKKTSEEAKQAAYKTREWSKGNFINEPKKENKDKNKDNKKIGSQPKSDEEIKEKFGSFFKKFKKENDYESLNKKTYKDLDDYSNSLLKKNKDALDRYWSEYNNYNNSNRYGSSKKTSNTETMRDKRWSKELKKNSGDSKLIDKWVKEMAEKYRKEHGLSRQDAIDKAEDYVDYWIDLYDEKSKR